MAGSTYALLLGVEHYQQDGLPAVPFALADAYAMRDILIQQMNVPPGNIKLWVDQEVTQNRLKQEIPYEIRGLSPEDCYIFFYAGHGFYAHGWNRITTWDTHAFNLPDTTTCLNEVLLSPLRNSPCRRSLVFIDACANTLGEAGMLGRSAVLGMQREEFAEFVTSTEYAAAFFSCSPTQKSYPSQKVGHGIWTHHLLRAFRGQEKRAFARDRCITGESLRDYLAVSVPAFIREQTTIKDEQNPYAVLAANGAFEILDVPESTPEEKPDPNPPVPTPVLDTAKAAAAHQEYGEQRKRLPDTEVMKKIWALPRWRLWSRPMEFRKARFQSLDHCAQFVASANVHSAARWTQYPWFQQSPEHGFESVAAEIDFVEPSVEHTERWVLFQSGQFVHNLALDRVLPLGKRTHVLEILDVITALFEFTARMADRKIFTNHVGIAVELLGVAGRQLAWREELNLDGWAQEDTISIDTICTASELQAGRRTLALDTAMSIYAQFGWDDPPKEELAAVQRQRFGAK
jgi:uncharacterized caspase-like protein